MLMGIILAGRGNKVYGYKTLLFDWVYIFTAVFW